MSIREQLSKAMDGWKKDVIIPADMYEVVVCYFSVGQSPISMQPVP
jgi:hypothetical protein